MWVKKLRPLVLGFDANVYELAELHPSFLLLYRNSASTLFFILPRKVTKEGYQLSPQPVDKFCREAIL